MKTVKTGECFKLIKTGGQFWIKLTAKLKNCEPTARRVSAKDAQYLIECGKSFDAACVMDFGVGVFQR